MNKYIITYTSLNELNVLNGTTIRNPKNDYLYVLKEIGLLGKYPIVITNNIHSERINLLENEKDIENVNGKEGDGIFTTLRDVVIGVRTADCAPIIFLQKQKEFAGVVHAGWRGLKAGIIQNAIKIIEEHYKESPENVLVVIGPTIGRCCYEVGPEFYSFFPFALYERDGKIFFDIKEYIVKILHSRGFRNIEVTNLCTSCNVELFYSYRKKKIKDKAQTMLTFVKL